jgi:glycosyltransferase involved in cell wall biosynthesis
MRIRYLVRNVYTGGGTARTVVNQANALCAEHDVEIASVYRPCETSRYAIDPRVRLRPLTDLRPDGSRRDERRGTRTSRQLARLRRLPNPLPHRHDNRFRRWDPAVDVAVIRYLREVEGDVLVTTRPGLHILAARFGNRDIVRVAQEHMNFTAYAPHQRRAITRAFRRLDAVVTLTAGDREQYARVLSGSGVELANIPNAFTPHDQPAAQRTGKVIVAAGRLHRQKGFDLLLQAFAIVSAKHPDWQLRIYGSGAQRNDLAALIEQLGLGDRARLMGKSDRLLRRMAEGSIFALSSRYEGFPMVLLEAMSTALPVVSFDCPTGPAEIVTPGVDGLLVAPHDVAALAAAISELIEDEPRRNSMGAAALEKADTYSMSRIMPMWEQLFARLSSAKQAA